MGVGGLIVIGGDGSFHGAHFLEQEHGVRVIGVPGTIDNDLFGTDYTIGYHTAVQTALNAVDRLRDTGASHERIFVIEVMGRHAGHIALEVALAGGAEDVLIPEDPRPLSEVIDNVQAGLDRGKLSSIVIVAEGYPGGANAVSEAITQATGQESRVSILGHIQRGGSPVAQDRVLASVLGEGAVLALLEGRTGVMVGQHGHDLTYTPLEATWTQRKDVLRSLYACVRRLSV
ncbi:ATP-dependent 6-phosphofructokinase [Deinococcus lacus]|uniref:6-phosphofructokinase n=1 Tax=Deinococcus lacus TaxID=392561 RepID=A0ABW1YBA0_9DEIO